MVGGLTEEAIERAIAALQRYVPAREPARPTLGPDPESLRRRALRGAHRGRDLLERTAGRAGFVHPHVDPPHVARAILRLVELSPGLERTAARLGDAASRRALLDVLVHRVAGPYHAPLEISADRFRSLQAEVDATERLTPGTWEVADPFFSPLSLYRILGPSGRPITLHVHSVDIVSVFRLQQYAYRRSAPPVAARPGDIVLDIGGCWGDTALLFADQVGPDGRVVTVEFDPANLEILHANLELNPELAERIEVVPAALWDRPGVRLPFAAGGRMTTVSAGTGAGAAAGEIETTTVDELVRERGIDRVGLIKMDVEGAEPRVLAGARATLARDRPRLAVAAYHADDDLVVLPDAITAVAPYRLYLQTFSPLEDETVLFAAPEAAPAPERPAASARKET